LAEESPPAEADEGPVRFGPYTLMRRIGAGGMGEVYLARENAVGRACVVKKVLPRLAENPHFVGRFRDEAKVVLRLAHPNIARVYAMGEAERQLYLSMEYVEGKTLSRFCHRLRQKGRVMPLGLSLLIAERMCRGLAYAHAAKDLAGQPLQLVHRDLSPANVCISYSGEVKIIDFGAAQSTLKLQQTAPRVVIGNLTYMSPEQARKRFVDGRADVYAVGVMLWELLSWEALPQKGDPVERWKKAATPHWDAPSLRRAGLSPAVDALVARAVHTSPEERFPDAASLGEALVALQQKLAPNVTDEDLGRLLSDVFAGEKKVEDEMLAELLRPPAPDGLPTEIIRLPPAFAPPTALAFEHRALAHEDEAEEPFSLGAAGLQQVAQDDEDRLHTVRMQGLMEALEPRLVRELEEAADSAELEPPTAFYPTARGVRWPYLAVCAFLGASAVGFAVVWWMGGA